MMEVSKSRRLDSALSWFTLIKNILIKFSELRIDEQIKGVVSLLFGGLPLNKEEYVRCYDMVIVCI